MTIMHNPFKGKFIAFHERGMISDHVVDNILFAAVRGLMTRAGAKLVLIPDTRHGKKGVLGRKLIGERLGKTDNGVGFKIGRTRKSDCITVKQLIRQFRKSETVTDKWISANSTPCENNKLEGEKDTVSPTPTIGTSSAKSANSRNACKTCDRPFSSKRADARFCSSRCRQKSYRLGAA